MSRRVLHGSFRLDLRPDEALPLFTPEGERAWVPEWRPRYPADAEAGGAAPGTVFLEARDETIWVALDHDTDRVRYARVTPGSRAGIVEVRCAADGDSTRIEVSYDLTALSPQGAAELERFAAGFDEYLAEWRRLIEESL